MRSPVGSTPGMAVSRLVSRPASSDQHRHVGIAPPLRQLRGHPEAGDAGDVLGAAAATPLLAAAGELGRREDAVSRHQRTHPLGAVRLVGAEADQVHPEAVEAEAEPAQTLDRIGVDQGTRVAGADGAGDRGDLLDGADLVVGQHHGHQDRVGPDRGSHLGGIDPPAPIAADHGQLGGTRPGERLRGGQDRLVLDRADHQVTAPLRTPPLQHPAQGQVVGLGAARGEGDLARRAAGGGGHPIPGLVHGGAGLTAVLVDRGGVAEPVPQPAQHRRPHLRVERGGGGVVQVEGLHPDQSTEPGGGLCGVLQGPRAGAGGREGRARRGRRLPRRRGPRPQGEESSPRRFPGHTMMVVPPTVAILGRVAQGRFDRGPVGGVGTAPAGRMWRDGSRGRTRPWWSARGTDSTPSGDVCDRAHRDRPVAARR